MSDKQHAVPGAEIDHDMDAHMDSYALNVTGGNGICPIPSAPTSDASGARCPFCRYLISEHVGEIMACPVQPQDLMTFGYLGANEVRKMYGLSPLGKPVADAGALAGAKYKGARHVAYAHGSESLYVVSVDHPNGDWDAIWCKTEAQAKAIVALVNGGEAL